MSRKMRLGGPLWLPLIVGGVGLGASAQAADRGSIQIVAIAPAWCRLAPASHPAPALLAGRAEIGPIRQVCNTVGGADVTARVTNLSGGTLQIGGHDVAVKPNGEAVLSAAQLAETADWRLVNAAPANSSEPVTLELTVVSN